MYGCRQHWGCVGLIVVLVEADWHPAPTSIQVRVYLTLLALSAGAFAALIPGLLHVNVEAPGITVRAIGAIGVFALVFFYEPAQTQLLRTLGIHVPEDPSDCQKLYSRASYDLAQKRYREAVKKFTENIEKCPADAVAWQELGLAYLDSGSDDKAFDAFKHGLDLAPTDPDLRYNVALSYSRLGNPQKAVEMFQNLLAQQPGSADVQYELGLNYQRLGKFDEMKPHYEAVIKAQEAVFAASAAFNLAAEYALKAKDCDSQDAQQAISLLRQSLAFAEKDIRPVSEGDTSQAIRTPNMPITLQPFGLARLTSGYLLVLGADLPRRNAILTMTYPAPPATVISVRPRNFRRRRIRPAGHEHKQSYYQH